MSNQQPTHSWKPWGDWPPYLILMVILAAYPIVKDYVSAQDGAGAQPPAATVVSGQPSASPPAQSTRPTATSSPVTFAPSPGTPTPAPTPAPPVDVSAPKAWLRPGVAFRQQKISRGDAYARYHFIAGPESGPLTITVTPDYGFRPVVSVRNKDLLELREYHGRRDDGTPLVVEFEAKFRDEYVVFVFDRDGKLGRFDISLR